MVKNTDFQAELKAKIKAGVKPSQLKRSFSTPVKSNKENLPSTSEQEQIIKKLEQQKADLLKINQEAVKQNEQLVQVIDKLKKENGQLVKGKSEIEEK
jgi:hypothetical protein